MTVTTPNVGVRTFLNTVDTAPLIIADLSTIGGVFTPDLSIDLSYFPPGEPVAFVTSDPVAVAAAGTAGTLKQTIDQVTAEGIVATIVAVIPPAWAGNASADVQMAAMVGSPSSMTGLYAMLGAQSQTGIVPDLLIAPGYTSQRPGNAANPTATAMDAIAERLITPVGICDTPATNKTDAVAWAADFESSLNLIATTQNVLVSSGGVPVVRPSAASIASLIVKTDKAKGAPYYSPGNQSLIGIVGPSRPVGFSISDPDNEANYLIQRGVNSLIQLDHSRTLQASAGKTFWGFVNTSSDPLWRAINVVRTRKAVREVIPRTLVKYVGRNLGPHLAVVLLQSLQDFLSELKSLPEPAILGGEVRWDRSLNDNTTLRTGGFVVSMDFEEAPPVLDIQVYTGRYAAAFDILAAEIQTAMAQASVGGTLA